MMECNKDEALRAKEIAEKKFATKDLAGAKKFALKAQNLFPALEGVDQMISTLDVHLAAEQKTNGEKDWYGIFSVHPSADEDTLKKQYRRLALQLHPDKNKSVGAEGAFQLISEAWSVLSDKSKKFLFDQKRNVKGVQQRTFRSKKDHAAPNAGNGIYNFAKNATPRPRAPKSTASAAPSVPPPPSTVNPSFVVPPPSTVNPSFVVPPPSTVNPSFVVPPPSTAPPPSKQSKSSTFWTSCQRCKMQYEYLRAYLNHNLLCPQCHEPFLAIETPAPSVQGPATQQHMSLNHNASVKYAFGPEKLSSGVQGMGSSGFQQVPHFDACSNPNFQWGAFSRTAGTASAAATSMAAAQAANMVHHTYEKVKRDREEAQAAVRREEALLRKINTLKRNHGGSENPTSGLDGNVFGHERPSFPKVDRPLKKRRGLGDDTETGFRVGEDEQMTTGTGNAGMDGFASYKAFNPFMGSYVERSRGYTGDFFKSRVSARPSNLLRELLKLNIRNMIKKKTKATIHKNLYERKSAEEAQLVEKKKSKKKQNSEESDKVKIKDAAPEDATDQDMDDSRSSSKKGQVKKDSSNGHNAEPDNEVEPLSIDVPDSDFHNFDEDRLERSFEDEQIWATYGDKDGMPRYYVLVQKVISLEPFKIRMSFLNSKSNSEFGQINWVTSGFAKTCGDFRVGRYELNNTINIFSHKVKWEKGPRGIIKIIPRKGDIWALYRNWSPDWNEDTPEDVMHKYDMVEVLEDYNEEQGVSITPLMKFAGFKTVFHRHLNPKEVQKIPREEMFRFSHQVPSIVLTGEEDDNAPKGCYELDPAATPLELLQVITESKDDEVMKTVS